MSGEPDGALCLWLQCDAVRTLGTNKIEKNNSVSLFISYDNKYVSRDKAKEYTEEMSRVMLLEQLRQHGPNGDQLCVGYFQPAADFYKTWPQCLDRKCWNTDGT